MEGVIEIDGVRHAFSIEGRRGRSVEFTLSGKPYTLEAVEAGEERVRIRLNGRPFDVAVGALGSGVFSVKPTERSYDVKAPFLPSLETWLRASPEAGLKRGSGSAAPAGEGGVTAPMPGKVLAVFVKPGASVKKGEVLLTLEAMKMENQIQSPMDGVVEAVHVEPGSEVGKGAVMVEIST